MRNQEVNPAETNNEEASEQDRMNSRGSNANTRKGNNTDKGKGRGKARIHGLTALSYGRSWSMEATEEYNRQIELHTCFR